MSNRDYRLFLHDIFESIAKIEEYTSTMMRCQVMT